MKLCKEIKRRKSVLERRYFCEYFMFIRTYSDKNLKFLPVRFKMSQDDRKSILSRLDHYLKIKGYVFDRWMPMDSLIKFCYFVASDMKYELKNEESHIDEPISCSKEIDFSRDFIKEGYLPVNESIDSFVDGLNRRLEMSDSGVMRVIAR